jgi:exodeoxyribonuclease V beta subunit
MVGDPKQAIYSFRNADLPTYLAAQNLATGRYTLGENQRSVEGLIAGCNALFGANRGAFLLNGIEYRSVRKGRKPLPRLSDASGEPRSPLQVWLLADGDGQWPTRADAFERAAGTTAGEIVRLLREGREGRLTIGSAGLRASDIAVLVRSHAHGRRMRLVLAALGVGSVELSQASVFETQEAEELERILVAVMEPGNERLVRAALATEILGCDAAALDALGYNETLFFDRLQRFADYRTLWDQRGFATMFRKLLREEGAEARLLNLERGERRLTNVLQLAELLAESARAHSSPDVLLRWLGNRRRQPGVDDAAQQRLESDRNLVHIVTIHKSKGLEYPIVFCPFLWDGYRTIRSDTPDLLEYHEPDGSAVLDFRPNREDSEEAAIKALRRDEQAAETVRQVYVAVTRAVQRCYLIAGCYKRAAKDRNCSTESTRSMLNWLVCGEGFDAGRWFDAKLEPAAIDAAWIALGAGCADPFTVAPLPDLSHQPALAAEPVAERLSARPAPGPAAPSWNRSSFSGLVRNLTHDAAVADHDTAADVAIAPLLERVEGPAPHDILAFPRGPAAGECIHHLFEHIDFTDPAGWDDAIRAALAAHPQGSVPDDADTLQRQLRGMLDAVLATELGPGICLGRIGRAERLTELGFTLPARALQPELLNAFLTTHGHAAGRLDFQTVSGYLSGAIDLVFRSGGRYFLLDWKSNHLGDGIEDYAPDRLSQAMTEHAYRLQYLLYSVALHRLLRRRLVQYDYDRHFGGVYYLFVRGVRPDWTTGQGPTGVFYDRPDAAMLRALDALIDGVDPGASA